MFSKDKPFPTRNKADGLQTKWIWCEPFLQVCHTRCLKVSDARFLPENLELQHHSEREGCKHALSTADGISRWMFGDSESA